MDNVVDTKKMAIEQYFQWMVRTVLSTPKGPWFLKQPPWSQLSTIADALEFAGVVHRSVTPHTAQTLEESLGRLFRAMSLGKGHTVYKIANRFGIHLHKTKLDIPVSTLPTVKERRTFYVQFPEGISFTIDGEVFDNVLFDLGPARDFGLTDLPPDAQIYHLHFVPNYASPEGDADKRIAPLASLCFSSRASNQLDTVLGAIHRSLKGQDPQLRIPDNIMEFCYKVLLYIYSGDPDLTPVAVSAYRPSKPEKYIRHLENHCPFEAINVGYSFHERHRHVDGTVRSGHYRWQPYGPGRTQVKLIWIDEHSVTFKRPPTPVDAVTTVL